MTIEDRKATEDGLRCPGEEGQDIEIETARATNHLVTEVGVEPVAEAREEIDHPIMAVHQAGRS